MAKMQGCSHTKEEKKNTKKIQFSGLKYRMNNWIYSRWLLPRETTSLMCVIDYCDYLLST